MSKKDTSYHRKSFYVLFAGALAALAAALVLSLEKIHLMNDPDAILSCTFNIALNCSTVMETWQASVFWGIPNMYIGLMAFPVIVTVAVAALWGGAQFNRIFMLMMNGGILLGTLFAYWLFFSSMYVIEVLCPWCLIVTTACTLMLASSTHITLRDKYLNLSKKMNKTVQMFLSRGYHQLLVASWIVLMIALVFIKFGSDLFA